MFRLIQNEWIKIFKRPGTYVMVGMIILMVGVVGAFTKYTDMHSNNQDQVNWKQQLTVQNQQMKQDLEQGHIPEMAKSEIEKNIAINEYRIKHDIAPDQGRNVWTFISTASQLISFVGLFTIIVSAGIVASEFNWGTIKLLLIRPIRRWKILLSKYLTIILFGLFLLSLLFVFSGLLGTVLFGTGEGSAYLAYSSGEVVEQSMLLHLIKSYLFSSVDLLMLATMAFMISAVFRNSSLAIGISIFLLFSGELVTSLVAAKFDWAKYILFANTNLMAYFDGRPVVEGMTLGFSVAVLIVYFIIFQALAFTVFSKRDVAA
ncbi:ABC transporter permease [Falsibacillus pallidus]|uniref:ABC-2 type transport system permease protein n=1 Tax=Falsibacillus pallidus TaxID=493781 RepID=A0A370GKB0_9BACI|nr:ABC transporter permease [Falsibacillus pallidus]RDI44101.1 ABC-2 type transport system permease protein [Falsibacillus pallidus]